MPDKSKDSHDPLGFTPRSGRLASEYAREQGWQLNEEERAKESDEKRPYDGGADYDYGAQDFGDSPTDTSSAQSKEPAKEPSKRKPSKKKVA